MKVTYEAGQRLCLGYVCSLCKGPLTLPWDGQMLTYIVRCPKCKNDEEFTPKSAAIKVEKADEDRMLKEDAAKADQRYQEAIPQARENYHKGVAPATGATARQGDRGLVSLMVDRDIGSNKDLTLEQLRGLEAWADQYGLDAWAKHVCIMYGQPYPTIEGLIYNARRQDPSCRMFTTTGTDEDKHNNLLGEGDILRYGHVVSREGIELAVRPGVVRAHELTDKSTKKPEELRYPIVADKPMEMADKRALYDALIAAFPLERVSEG